MTTERVVRFTDQFFERLEQLLPEERPGNGGPSLTDFLVFDLPPIHDALARDALGSTLPTDNPAIRVYIGLGALVGQLAIFLTIHPDDDIECFLDFAQRRQVVPGQPPG